MGKVAALTGRRANVPVARYSQKQTVVRWGINGTWMKSPVPVKSASRLSSVLQVDTIYASIKVWHLTKRRAGAVVAAGGATLHLWSIALLVEDNGTIRNVLVLFKAATPLASPVAYRHLGQCGIRLPVLAIFRSPVSPRFARAPGFHIQRLWRCDSYTAIPRSS